MSLISFNMVTDWTPTNVLEGWEEVWVTFHSEELNKDVTIEVCSVEDLIYRLIGDSSEVAARIAEEE
tara:strand:- start:2018 stop:2218 length:201 start_codon:yes stop_codon:yes gene_type:complete